MTEPSSYYTGKVDVDERLRRLYYLQGLSEEMTHFSYYGDLKYWDEMKVLRWEITQLHGKIILKEDALLKWKMLGPSTDETIDALTEIAETYHEYLKVLGLMF